MYGKKRVVLSTPRYGIGRVSVSGDKSHFPLGVWFFVDGHFYADLKSKEQLFQLVSNDNLANKMVGGCKSKNELREFVMDYYNNIRS